MNATRRAVMTILALLCSPFAAYLPAANHAGKPAQSVQRTGAIEFVARVRPTAGRPEPVRELTFYLLHKSLADIQKEVEETEPKPNLDRFIDSLEVSPELKAWMKKQRSVELGGTDFIRRLKPDDIFKVPEFYDAYMQRNSADVGVGFPAPKYREADKQRDPQKYEKLKQEYHDAIRRWVETNPQSVDGIDVHLDAINPGQRWAKQESELRQRIYSHALKLAQTRYLAATTDTDLNGRGAFTGLPPGQYWLGTLDSEAVAGDARLRWDVSVSVRAGETTRVELSNLNAIEPPRPAK